MSNEELAVETETRLQRSRMRTAKEVQVRHQVKDQYTKPIPARRWIQGSIDRHASSRLEYRTQTNYHYRRRHPEVVRLEHNAAEQFVVMAMFVHAKGLRDIEPTRISMR